MRTKTLVTDNKDGKEEGEGLLGPTDDFYFRPRFGRSKTPVERKRG